MNTKNKQHAKPSKRAKPVTWDGIKFESLSAAARHFGITRQAMHKRVTHGWTKGERKIGDEYVCAHCDADLRNTPTYLFLEPGYAGFLRKVEYCVFCYTVENGQIKRKA